MKILALFAFLYACVIDDRARAWFALAVAAFLMLYDIAYTLSKSARCDTAKAQRRKDRP